MDRPNNLHFALFFSCPRSNTKHNKNWPWSNSILIDCFIFLPTKLVSAHIFDLFIHSSRISLSPRNTRYEWLGHLTFIYFCICGKKRVVKSSRSLRRKPFSSSTMHRFLLHLLRIWTIWTTAWDKNQKRSNSVQEKKSSKNTGTKKFEIVKWQQKSLDERINLHVQWLHAVID